MRPGAVDVVFLEVTLLPFSGVGHRGQRTLAPDRGQIYGGIGDMAEAHLTHSVAQNVVAFRKTRRLRDFVNYFENRFSHSRYRRAELRRAPRSEVATLRYAQVNVASKTHLAQKPPLPLSAAQTARFRGCQQRRCLASSALSKRRS